VVGFNLYQGTRHWGNCAAPSPVEGPGQSSYSQFYRHNYEALCQFQVEKISNPLSRAAIHIASILDPVLHSIFPASYCQSSLRFCSQKILTFSKFGETMGFCNTRYTDKRDVVKVKDLLIIKKMIEPHCKSTNLKTKLSAEYIQKWIKWGPIGISTTCVYQFVGNCEGDDIRCYFLMDGLGIAVCMHTHICHLFFGHVFSHRTALPIIVRKGMVMVYHDPNFQVLPAGAMITRRGSFGTNNELTTKERKVTSSWMVNLPGLNQRIMDEKGCFQTPKTKQTKSRNNV
jgi:hypothetical protein